MRITIFSTILVSLTLLGIAFFNFAVLDQSATLVKTKSDSGSMRVVIADLPIAQALPLYVAMERGYFDEAGIVVERIRMDSPAQIVDGLLSGRVDMAIDAATGIVAVAEAKIPGRLKIFMLAGGTASVRNDSILVPNDSSLSFVTDLRGGTLGVLPGIQWRAIAAHVLSKNDLTVGEDVTLVEIAPGLQIQALASKQIDALLAVEPIPTVILGQGIGKEIMLSPTAIYVADPFFGGAGVVSDSFRAKHPQTVTAVIEVLKRAVEDIRLDPAGVRPYLTKYTALSDVVSNDVPLPIFVMKNELTDTDQQSLQAFINVFTELGLLAQTVDGQALLIENQ
jgi:NitT/TauT family transport system substrate-binding protein